MPKFNRKKSVSLSLIPSHPRDVADRFPVALFLDGIILFSVLIIVILPPSSHPRIVTFLCMNDGPVHEDCIIRADDAQLLSIEFTKLIASLSLTPTIPHMNRARSLSLAVRKGEIATLSTSQHVKQRRAPCEHCSTL